jgi:hypothetical protein
MHSAALTILSCNSFTFCTFHNKHILQTPGRKIPEESKVENEGAKELVLFILSSGQETACLERHEHIGRSEMVHHLSGKPFM